MKARVVPITLNAIRSRLQKIRDLAASGDYEAAHAQRDALYQNVLESIANTDPRLEHIEQKLARAALKAKEISFPEHCS